MGCKITQTNEIYSGNVEVTFPDGSKKKFPKPLYLANLLKYSSLSSPDIIGLMINGTAFSLNSRITFGIANVEPIEKKSSEGLAMYKRTLVKIFATAVNSLYSKEFNVLINHNVNNGYLVRKSNDNPFSEE